MAVQLVYDRTGGDQALAGQLLGNEDSDTVKVYARRSKKALREAAEREWLAIVSRAPIERCDVRFRFQCPKAWESLTSTDDATVRHCGTCEKPVFFCSDLTEVRVHGGAKRCVAFSPRLLRTEALAEYEDEATGSTMMMGEIDVDPGEWLEDAPTLVR